MSKRTRADTLAVKEIILHRKTHQISCFCGFEGFNHECNITTSPPKKAQKIMETFLTRDERKELDEMFGGDDLPKANPELTTKVDGIIIKTDLCSDSCKTCTDIEEREAYEEERFYTNYDGYLVCAKCQDKISTICDSCFCVDCWEENHDGEECKTKKKYS